MKAKHDLNTLYREEDYPQPHELFAKFDFSLSVMPVPDAKDFRVDIGDSQRQLIVSDIERRMEQQQKDAVKTLYDRARGVVHNISERLGDEKKTFRDTLISNARALLQILPTLNFTNDPELNQLAADIDAILVPPDRLREDVVLRSETAKKADAILERMRGMM